MGRIALSVHQGRYRYTDHGADQQLVRGVADQELEEAIASGEIIEDYPENYKGPACLILGWTLRGRPLHIVCSVKLVVCHR